jgi:hypothetical protein
MFMKLTKGVNVVQLFSFAIDSGLNKLLCFRSIKLDTLIAVGYKKVTVIRIFYISVLFQ